MPIVVWVIICGIIGGVVGLLIQRARQPSLNLNVGTILQNLFLGGVAAFLFWAFSEVTSVEPGVYALAILCGAGGSTLIVQLYASYLGSQDVAILARSTSESEKTLRELRSQLISIATERSDAVMRARLQLLVRRQTGGQLGTLTEEE